VVTPPPSNHTDTATRGTATRDEPYSSSTDQPQSRLPGSIQISVLTNPGVHHDPSGNPGIDRPSRPKLRDRHNLSGLLVRIVSKPRPFLPKNQNTPPRQGNRLQPSGPRRIVNSDNSKPGLSRVFHERGHINMMLHMLIPISDHGPTPIPPPPSHNMHGPSGKSIGRPNNGPNIVVVLKVLNSHMELMPARVKISDHGIPTPIPIGVDHVATITGSEQRGIPTITSRPLTDPGPDADR
jgi:hypothetical protein